MNLFAHISYHEISFMNIAKISSCFITFWDLIRVLMIQNICEYKLEKKLDYVLAGS